jgi:hypothetical protein
MADQPAARSRCSTTRCALGGRHRQAAGQAARGPRPPERDRRPGSKAPEPRAGCASCYAGPKVDEAFSRFDVLERQADYAEGRAEALGLGAPPKTLDEEIAELRNADKVDAELEAMKARAKRSKGKPRNRMDMTYEMIPLIVVPSSSSGCRG